MTDQRSSATAPPAGSNDPTWFGLPRWVFGVVALAIAVGVVLVIVGIVRAEPDAVDPEFVKSGMQLIVVGVFGGSLSYGWREVEQRRQRLDANAAADRRRHEAVIAADRDRREVRREKQLRLFVRLVESYNEIKAVKRILRSYGFVHGRGPLDARQVDGFRQQMLRLNDVQLDVEALKREIGEARQFDDKSDEIVTQLYTIDRYLNRLVTFWERHGFEIDVGIDTSVVTTGLQPLIDDSDGYRNNITRPRRRASELMQDVFAEQPSDLVERSRAWLNRYEPDDDLEDAPEPTGA